MTDPRLITTASPGGSSRQPPPLPVSPSSQASSSASPPISTAPSQSSSTSGSRPSTAPQSPEPVKSISTVSQQTMQPQPSPPSKAPQMDGVVLGLQQLERQQAEQEQKRQALAVQQQQAAPHDSEDDDTAPSSAQNSNTNELMDPGAHDEEDKSSSIGRFLQNTRRRLSSRDLASKDPANEPVIHPVYGKVSEMSEVTQYGGRPLLICGYLHKRGRNGKWQKRFFECDGEDLSYYKTSSRIKLLATLNLVKVGDITIEEGDQSSCTFKIVIADRDYILRADSASSCKDWVITLNRVKEARLHLGGVHLVHSLDNDDAAPRVVLAANRQRTKAVNGEDIHSWEDIVAAENAAKNQEALDSVLQSANRLSDGSKRLQQAVAATWQKRQTSLQRLAFRLLYWARSVKIIQKSGCRKHAEDQVVLDSQIHPPGHRNPAYASEATVADTSGVPEQPQTLAGQVARGSRDEEGGETRELS